MVTSGMPRVGVLALQGDVREHVRSLEALGAEAVAVRRPAELATVSGLVIPGGESSVIDKLARTFGLQQPIRAAIADGMPVYGTCAGLILLADRIADGIRGQESVGGLDITVQRNAFGSQIDSFETQLEVAGFDTPVSATFIRAPRVVQTGPDVDVLASLPDGAIVAVRQGALLGTAFHPEMSGETRFHELLLDLIAARAS
ncbi:pyridoxal 5'-phosphate synthase glutaminase subunit PdxT [Microbacterium sp. B24]|uniref:pyridoxal 5'-phosphate synthase glutaminase subunit PdxT n=1 Tax=Microbacterium sp. B24 TaxID=95616 RepID=UPI00055D7AB4|nr:pyridoxal 5'-phosphate synthase glutaminase subunit PdxT [Microbacterium sp. B24]